MDEQIELQSKLLEAKDAQLETIGKRVEESVKTSLQTEMQTYSDSVSKRSGPSITPAEARKIATTIAKEEERASHVMLFRLEEKKGEDLRKEVECVFAEVGEKPVIEQVQRIGHEK